MMSRQSPAVARVVAVLNFFAEHPQQAFTLTQVIKSLHLSRATTHAILLGFVEAGYLYRRPDKSYVLGPVLPSLLAGAQENFSPLAVANQELRGLADEFGVIASALFLEGDEMIVRDRAASVHHIGFARGVSGRAYGLFPYGSIFLTGLSPRELAMRIEAAKPALTQEGREDVLRAVAFARRYGFVASLADAADSSGGEDVSTRLVSDIDRTSEYQLYFMIAPVTGVDRQPEFAVSLFGFLDTLTGDAILQCGDRLRESCGRISSFIGGGRTLRSDEMS